MRATWHSSLLVAAIGSIVLCAACAAGSSPASLPPASVTPVPVPSSSGDPTSSIIPGVVPAPRWPIPGVDAGNTATPKPGPDGVIDLAWAWGSLAWSPDGTTLAAAALSQEDGEGQIHLFDRTGHPVGAVPGWRAVWTDDHDLMTLASNADGVGSSAWRWSSDGGTSALVAPNAGDLLGSSLGRVAITFRATDSAAATFRVWTPTGLSGALPGSPAAWSPDGRTLAVLRDSGTAFGPTSPGVILAATGSVPPVWLQVLDGSDLRPLAGFPASLFDPRLPILFDPSGTLIATSDFVFDLARGVADARPPSSEAVAWGTDGRLIVATFADHTISTWDPTTHTLSASFSPGTRLPTADHQIVTVPPRTGEWGALVTPGVVSPDGELRAWDPQANGIGNTPLRLVPAAAAGP
jgi:WD40 repeat protein